MADLLYAAKMLHERKRDLSAKYKWKAENIVRFLEKLGMTPEQKVKFVADELAGAYLLGESKKLEERSDAH